MNAAGRTILKRLALAGPTLLGITVLTFAVAHWAPGDPLGLSEDAASSSGLEAARRASGIDRPWPEQYLTWLVHFARADLGRSLVDQRPVAEKIGEALPRTLLLSGLALAAAWLLAVPLGAWLARWPTSRRARAVSASLALASGLPTFWVAMLALFVFANPRRLDWFPFQGLRSEGGGLVDLAWHLVLPVLVLTSPTLALAARHVEAAMRQALSHESVLAARARGIPERSVVWRHAFRNSLVPLVTLLGLQLPHLVGGSVVVERVFGIPGMGLLAFEAVGTRDYPVVMAVATVMGAVTLLAMVLADVGAVAADPRLRHPEGR